jgi:hypothetical protein
MTTLDDLSASLPNGFHDAEMLKLEIDYTKREAILTLDVWVAESMESAERESYRMAELTFSGLLFWVTEPPDLNYPYDVVGSVRIDTGSMDTLKDADAIKLPPIPEGAFVNWIYSADWNSRIFVAAEGASLKWIGSQTVRHYPCP